MEKPEERLARILGLTEEELSRPFEELPNWTEAEIVRDLLAMTPVEIDYVRWVLVRRGKEGWSPILDFFGTWWSRWQEAKTRSREKRWQKWLPAESIPRLRNFVECFVSHSDWIITCLDLIAAKKATGELRENSLTICAREIYQKKPPANNHEWNLRLFDLFVSRI